MARNALATPRGTASTAASPSSGAARRTAGRSSGSWRWLQGLGCGALITLAAPTALLGGVLLAPALLAWVMDGVPNRPVAKPILLFGLAAAAQPIAALWHLGHGFHAALTVLDQPTTLAACWAAQAGGWLALELVPVGLMTALDRMAESRAARVALRRAAFMDEWDISTGG
jgi:hypothetical protein